MNSNTAASSILFFLLQIKMTHLKCNLVKGPNQCLIQYLIGTGNWNEANYIQCKWLLNIWKYQHITSKGDLPQAGVPALVQHLQVISSMLPSLTSGIQANISNILHTTFNDNRNMISSLTTLNSWIFILKNSMSETFVERMTVTDVQQ